MKKSIYILMLSLCCLYLSSCQTDYANLPTYTNTKQLQAVIEIPAGNNHKLTYNLETKEFITAKKAGQDFVVDFLPYPGNYGFIPSTQTDKNGRGLNILVLAERLETGTVIEVTPIAVLQLETAGELQPVIIAVPARPSEQTITATDYNSLTKEYPIVKDILAKWFVHYNSTVPTSFVAWRNEHFAKEEIQRWMKL